MGVVAPLADERSTAQGVSEPSLPPLTAPDHPLASSDAREVASALHWRNLLTLWMLAAPAEW